MTEPPAYPRELERDLTLGDGTPGADPSHPPEDAPRLVTAYDRLSAHSAYQRFFSVRRRLPPDWARFLATVDYRQRLALIAERPADGQMELPGRGALRAGPGRRARDRPRDPGRLAESRSRHRAVSRAPRGGGRSRHPAVPRMGPRGQHAHAGSHPPLRRDRAAAARRRRLRAGLRAARVDQHVTTPRRPRERALGLREAGEPALPCTWRPSPPFGRAPPRHPRSSVRVRGGASRPPERRSATHSPPARRASRPARAGRCPAGARGAARRWRSTGTAARDDAATGPRGGWAGTATRQRSERQCMAWSG